MVIVSLCFEAEFTLGSPHSLRFNLVRRFGTGIRPSLLSHTHEWLDVHVSVEENLTRQPDFSQQFSLTKLVILRLRHYFGLALDESYATGSAFSLASAPVPYVDTTILDCLYQAALALYFIDAKVAYSQCGHPMYLKVDGR